MPASATSASCTAQLARRLEHIVRLDVRAPDVVIEDACQFAWSRLLHHRHRVHRETAITWLARTAVHEAFKLLRRDGREAPLEAALDQASPASPHDLVERRERLAEIGDLPERQQRVLWLHALGLSYAEIARARGVHGAHGRAAAATREGTRQRRGPGLAPAQTAHLQPLPRPPALAPPALGRAQLARLGALLGPRPPALVDALRIGTVAHRRAPARVAPDEERDAAEHDERTDRDDDRRAAAEAASAAGGRRGRDGRGRRGGRNRHARLREPRLQRVRWPAPEPPPATPAPPRGRPQGQTRSLAQPEPSTRAAAPSPASRARRRKGARPRRPPRGRRSRR